MANMFEDEEVLLKKKKSFRLNRAGSSAGNSARSSRGKRSAKKVPAVGMTPAPAKMEKKPVKKSKELDDKTVAPKMKVASASSAVGKKALANAGADAEKQSGAKKNDVSADKDVQSEEVGKKLRTDELLAEATKHIEAGRMKDAEKMYIEAVHLSPRDERVYYGLGELYFLGDSYKDAKSSFVEATKLNETFVLPLSRLGLIAYREKDFDLSAEYYERASKIEPNEVKHVANHALALRAGGNLKKSLKMYLKAFEVSDTNKDVAGKVVDVALELGKPKKALPVVEELEASDKEGKRAAKSLRKRLDEALAK